MDGMRREMEVIRIEELGKQECRRKFREKIEEKGSMEEGKGWRRNMLSLRVLFLGCASGIVFGVRRVGLRRRWRES